MILFSPNSETTIPVASAQQTRSRVSYLYTNKARIRREKALLLSFCYLWMATTLFQLTYAIIFRDHFVLIHTYNDAAELLISIICYVSVKRYSENSTAISSLEEYKKSTITKSFGLSMAILFSQIASAARILHHSIENTKIEESMLSFGNFRCGYRAIVSIFFMGLLHSYWLHPLMRIKFRKRKGISEYTNALNVIDTLSKWDAYKELMHVSFILNLIIFGKAILEYIFTLRPYDLNSSMNVWLSLSYSIALIGIILAICEPVIYSGFRNLMQGTPFGYDILLKEMEKKLKNECNIVRFENVKAWMADFTRVIGI
jgi:hypothetical protein